MLSESLHKARAQPGRLEPAENLAFGSYTLVMEGKGGPGFVKGSARIELKEKGRETELRCDAEAQVGGMIAAIGSRLVEAIGKKMTDGFFKRFGEEVSKAA